MVKLDSRWRIPKVYEYDLLEPCRPLVEPHRLCEFPETQLLALRRVESYLNNQEAGPLELASWQTASGSDLRALHTIQALLSSTPQPSPETRLACAHILSALRDPDVSPTLRLDLYLALWKGKEIAKSDPRRIELGICLAGDDLPGGEKEVSETLEAVRRLLDHASPTEHAMFDLVVAVTTLRSDPNAAEKAIVGAHKRFQKLSDAVGMAQCALAEYQRERLGAARAELMLAYLEYAVHQYEVSCRYAWAARTLWSSVVPLLCESRASHNQVVEAFNRAALYADRSCSYPAWDSVLHFARRFNLYPRLAEGGWAFEPRTANV